jgi:hypothetical protein
MKALAIRRTWAAASLLALIGFFAPAHADDDSPPWQPMLAKSFVGNLKDLGVNGMIVYRTPGCVFLQIDGKVYCSAAGAKKFNLVKESWKEVADHADKVNKSKHLFVLTDTGIKESKDGGKTWLADIALPKGFVTKSQSWVQYDAANDVVYLMQRGSDLYKLSRR